MASSTSGSSDTKTSSATTTENIKIDASNRAEIADILKEDQREQQRRQQLQQYQQLGILVGETKPNAVIFEAQRHVSVGEYIIINVRNKGVLGVIEKSYINSDALSTSNIRNYKEAYENMQVAELNDQDKSFQGYIRIIGYVNELKRWKTLFLRFLMLSLRGEMLIAPAIPLLPV